MKVYRFYCGNVDCSSRREVQPDGSIGRLFPINEAELEDTDGRVWLCSDCTASSIEAAS